MLDSKPTITEKLKAWLQEAPALPMNAGGLPFHFREFFYHRDECGRRSRFTLFGSLFVGFSLLLLNLLPSIGYTLDAVGYEKALLEVAQYWTLTVVGLCWLAQYLKPGHNALLVAPYAFISPWALYALNYQAPITALLAGFAGLLVAGALAFAFRSRHRYRKVDEQLSPEEFSTLKKLVADGRR